MLNLKKLLYLSALVVLSTCTSGEVLGDAFCSDLMCVQGVKDTSKGTVVYTLYRAPNAITSSSPGFGWIAIGWGTTMANSPMLIAWPYTNSATNSSTITFSQREATGHIEPTVQTWSNSPTLIGDQTKIASANTYITFSILDSAPPAKLNLIWAYSSVSPGSSSNLATLTQHDESGAASLDLTKAIAVSGSSTQTLSASLSSVGVGGSTETKTASLVTGYVPGQASATANAGPALISPTSIVSGSYGSSGGPYTAHEKVILAHAIFGSLGALLVIPGGVIAARLLRASKIGKGRWVGVHWGVNLFGGVCVIIAFALGIQAVEESERSHFGGSSHQTLGILYTIFLLFQLIFGFSIHFLPKRVGNTTTNTINGRRRRRSLANWIHPLTGILILVLGYAQVWLGFGEWNTWSGRPPIGTVVKGAIWGVFVGLFVVIYSAGLFLLPKQFRDERMAVSNSADSAVNRIISPLDDDDVGGGRGEKKSNRGAVATEEDVLESPSTKTSPATWR